MKGMAFIDGAVLVVYLASMVAMGVWLGRKNNTPDQFMKAGGAIPGWAVGLSIFGTYVSSISFLALPGKAFATNWTISTKWPAPLGHWVSPFHSFMITVIGTLTILLVGLAGSGIIKRMAAASK